MICTVARMLPFLPGYLSQRLREIALLQIGLHGLDQFLGAARTVGASVRVDDVESDVVFDHFCHQARHGAARCDNEVQHAGAALFLLECPFHGFDLAANAPYPVQELHFLALGVRHG